MDTKTKILEIAKQEFSKKGYASTTLEDIAQQVGITKPAIYYYFRNKKDLYNQLFLTYFGGFQQELTGNWEVDLTKYISIVVEWFKDRELARLFSMELSSGMLNLEDGVLGQIAKIMDRLVYILDGQGVNPFYIQTLIVSSVVTYYNTLEIRSKIAQLNTTLDPNFDLYTELIDTIIPYIKSRQKEVKK